MQPRSTIASKARHKGTTPQQEREHKLIELPPEGQRQPRPRHEREQASMHCHEQEQTWNSMQGTADEQAQNLGTVTRRYDREEADCIEGHSPKNQYLATCNRKLNN